MQHFAAPHKSNAGKGADNTLDALPAAAHRAQRWPPPEAGMAAFLGRAFIALAAALLLWCIGVLAPSASAAAPVKNAPPAAPAQAVAKLDNATCLNCHGPGKEKIEVAEAGGKKRPMFAVDHEKYGKSVHSKMDCVACHREIVDDKSPHQKAPATPKPNCIECHTALWDKTTKENKAAERPRLGIVVQNIEAYRQSFHAQASKDDPSRPRAYCDQCHNTHTFDVPPLGSAARKGPWRLDAVPAICGEKCHGDQLDDYKESVHGQAIFGKKDPKGAICIDCHTSHSIAATTETPFKLQISEQCGTCHKENFGSYADSYHGQVNILGYAHTAKCYDCHGSHGIAEVDDPNAKVHPNNKLGTCRQCHDGKKLKEATPGFVSFAPHATIHNFERYPQMWVMGRFMLALLGGVFAFFWLHSALWFYREYRERKARLDRPHVQAEALPAEHGKQFRRFGPLWRLGHLVFALSVMTLVLTGMAVFYADSAWAPVVMRLLGGPKTAGLIHRTAAAIMLSIFFTHLAYVIVHLWRIRKTFRWFGPDSLIPNWKDIKDIVGMFRWGLGLGPKPLFDRWTYWEKFDYWAVFWGMGIIGTSGAMLAFPTEIAAILPGWVLNVATLVHGEEAFLAAVFLFTVHFFNNHFRPEKMPPPDVVMFTGSVELDEFRREHPLQYTRLKDAGELEKFLVAAPSRPMALGSRLLGFVLITAGLTLLVLVVSGFLGA